MTQVVVRAAAVRDINNAHRYYEEEAELGGDFIKEIDRSFEQLGTMQHRFPEVRPGVRRAILNRFPYAIYFTIRNSVTVLAVLHMHRSPLAVTTRTRR